MSVSKSSAMRAIRQALRDMGTSGRAAVAGARDKRIKALEADRAVLVTVLSEAHAYLKCVWSGSLQQIDHRALRLMMERLGAALQPTPTEEADDGKA